MKNSEKIIRCSNFSWPDLTGCSFWMSSIYEGVTIANAEGKIVYFNKAQAKIEELDPQDMLRKKVTDFYRVDESVSTTKAVSCLIALRTVVDTEKAHLPCVHYCHAAGVTGGDLCALHVKRAE